MIKAVFCGLESVLLDVEYELAAWRLTGGESRAAGALTEFFQESQTAHAFKTGRLTPEQYYEILREGFPITVAYDRFTDLYNQIFQERGAGIELFQRLKSTYPITIISNIDPLHARYVQKAFPLFGSVQHFVASCEVGVCQPDPLIYQAALEKSGTAGNETLYLDDEAENVAGAQSLGIQGVLFQDDRSAMAERLKQAGVTL